MVSSALYCGAGGLGGEYLLSWLIIERRHLPPYHPSQLSALSSANYLSSGLSLQLKISSRLGEEIDCCLYTPQSVPGCNSVRNINFRPPAHPCPTAPWGQGHRAEEKKLVNIIPGENKMFQHHGNVPLLPLGWGPTTPTTNWLKTENDINFRF